MDRESIFNHITILQEELMPALGCTEPIAVAFAAAKVREVLGRFPEHMIAHCSGNIIKNVKSVTVPNSNGLRGIDAAAILGAVGGQAEKKLEVLEGIQPDHIRKTISLLDTGYCEVRAAVNVDKLYLKIEASAGGGNAAVVIQGHHTNITDIEKNGRVLLHHDYVDESSAHRKGDRSKLTVRSILEFADAVDMEELWPIMEPQIQCNMRISEEGMDTRYGAGVARAMLDDGNVSSMRWPLPKRLLPPRPEWPAVPCLWSSIPAAAIRALPFPCRSSSMPGPCITQIGSFVGHWLSATSFPSI